MCMFSCSLLKYQSFISVQSDNTFKFKMLWFILKRLIYLNFMPACLEFCLPKKEAKFYMTPLILLFFSPRFNAGVQWSSVTYWIGKPSLWWLLLDTSAMHSQWSEGSFRAASCGFEGRMQLEVGCCNHDYGGMFSPNGGYKNRHRHDTSSNLQLGVSNIMGICNCPLNFTFSSITCTCLDYFIYVDPHDRICALIFISDFSKFPE